MTDKNIYGLIEGGGTKFVCAIGTNATDIQDKLIIPTQDADNTLADVIEYFQNAEQNHGKLKAIGFGCFGPLDINPESASYGEISLSVKPGWTDSNISKALSETLNIPVVIESDVNVALLGEANYGAGRNFKNIVYITIGTGIGAGFMSNGQVINGLSHPEIGHILAAQQNDDLNFDGVCPVHRDMCFEGLASGPAIQARWGKSANQLAEDHPAWDLEARYLAALCLNITMTVMPEVIILGGGVMQQTHIFPLIHKHFITLNKEYCGYGKSIQQMNNYIVPSALQTDAGILGALVLSQKKI